MGHMRFSGMEGYSPKNSSCQISHLLTCSMITGCGALWVGSGLAGGMRMIGVSLPGSSWPLHAPSERPLHRIGRRSARLPAPCGWIRAGRSVRSTLSCRRKRVSSTIRWLKSTSRETRMMANTTRIMRLSLRIFLIMIQVISHQDSLQLLYHFYCPTLKH
jgi:hypothetical protein